MGSELCFTPIPTMFTAIAFLAVLVLSGKSSAMNVPKYPPPPPPSYPPPPAYQPPVYPPAADDLLEVPETVYNPDLTANENGYGQRDPNCHIEEKVVFEDKCETYPEQMCYTQNVEKCRTESYKNCTGTIETEVDRVCFDVVELVRGLEEKIDFETLTEEFQVQKCTVVKDRVCDTTFDIDVNNRDDFQCCNVEADYCEEHEEVINDVTCKNTFEFDCKKEKRTDGGYGKEVARQICDQTEKKTVAPVCVMEDRLKCDYIPVKQCDEETKKYCYKVEKLVKEEVCDKKFATEFL